MAVTSENSGRELVLENVGAVEHLRLTIPDRGGIVVFRGRNGVGKSTALEAIESLSSSKPSLPKRDGEEKASISGLGVRITVNKRASRSGELECTTLEGRLDLASFVDPGLIDPIAADKQRIRALVSLSGVKADPALFHELPGGLESMSDVASERALHSADLIEMATLLKRDFEYASRLAGESAQAEESHATAAREQASGVDASIEMDDRKLQASLEAAISEHARIRGAMENARRLAAQAADAQRRIDEANARQAQKSADLRLQCDSARESVTAAQRDVAAAQEALREAEKRKANAAANLQRLHDQLNAAIDLEYSMSQWQDLVDRASARTGPSESSEQDAAFRLAEAREAVELGAVARHAVAKSQQATAHDEKARRLREKEARLRNAAQGIDGVLSRAVDHPVLRVQDGRLVLETSRGTTSFSELSNGERWKIAIDLGVARVGEGGMLVIPQEAWEGMDPINRLLVAEHVKQCGVVVFTASAAAGDLSVEAFDE